MNDPIKLTAVDGRNDAERAATIRSNLRPLLEQVAQIVTDARKDGLIVSFNISPDQYGRCQVTALDVTKPL